MARYSIEDTTLTSIGDALRNHHGETKAITVIEEVEMLSKVSKTSNATGFDSFEGEYSAGTDGEILDTVTIKEASRIHVKMAYQTISKTYGYVQVAAGSNVSAATTKYGGTLSIVELDFPNTNTVTFRFYDAASNRNYLGYYAEITGYDAEGNLVSWLEEKEVEKEVPNKYNPLDMADAIDAIEKVDESLIPTEEELVITGSCNYRFSNDGWDWIIEKYGDRITTVDITNAQRMFENCEKLTNIPFDINLKKDGSVTMSYMFGGCKNLTNIPTVNNAKLTAADFLFSSCNKIREIPEDIDANWDWSAMDTLTSGYSGNRANTFQNCFSLRKFPMSFLSHGNPYIYYSYSIYSNGFSSCYALDEIVNLPNPHLQTEWTSNAFTSTFNNCHRLKNLTFALQEDGTPYTVKWKSQTIDFTSDVGYMKYATYILNYNSGITADKEVIDDATYQALKDNPDWFTTDIAYSRYNHDSAVATINSLPDTSAYLAEKGGTNTIKFKGASGSATDGGAINTLTEEEIAVATAKGWTVTLV